MRLINIKSSYSNYILKYNEYLIFLIFIHLSHIYRQGIDENYGGYMIFSKFSIGQQVRHRLLGYLGVIIDVDPEYSLEKPTVDEITVSDALRKAPWYHVVMEDDTGRPIHTYLAEAQLGYEETLIHPEQPILDDLSESIRLQLQAPRLKN